MNYNELAKLMKEAGWYFYRIGKGSHKLWAHPNRQDQIPIPDHGSREIDPGLLRGIRKKAGLK
jgi:predicted RNA binding protein YcfA (HicA-like mRNA interferase family)